MFDSVYLVCERVCSGGESRCGRVSASQARHSLYQACRQEKQVCPCVVTPQGYRDDAMLCDIVQCVLCGWVCVVTAVTKAVCRCGRCTLTHTHRMPSISSSDVEELIAE